MKRQPSKPVRRTKSRKTSKKITQGKILKYSALLLFCGFLVAMAYQYRHGFLYWLGFKTDKRVEALSKEERKIENLRIYEIVERHKDKVFGIDVSHYQDKIDWEKLKNNNDEFPLGFVFVRATAGKNKVDSEFKNNWKGVKEHGYLRGAYHYYRPDENSVKQADNFIKNVKLSKGDLPPVLDIEKIPNGQSLDSLQVGLKRWLDKVEKHYGMKPIIYSGESFYTYFLKEEFEGYDLWVASYSFFEDEIRNDWLIWQFTDKGELKGIKGMIDVDIYNGNMDELRQLCK
ncbi:MAG: glycoside hydrolase [Flavobacterium psychrophilum]|nr:MAG: glycoside hydrolase [Flavobacterium psychrophilum]